ncbi:MAG: hypothetical protein NPINA01_22990 [Nitrospinaceae bacterium]|nr:MAG: hypothetical protein NPINA01_22990 [Nitrospinaceae bacterium]
MSDDKEKNKEDAPLSDKEKRKASQDPKEEKESSLAKRSGQRPALPFKRKPPT